MRPPLFSCLFFYFFYFINLLDTRLTFALTAYPSLKHSLKSVSLSHTPIHTLHPPSKKRTHSFNSIGGENIAIGWDLFPNAHRWRCEAFGLRSTSGALDLWAILFLFFPIFCSSAESCFREINKDMDYSLCLFLLLATVSSESSGQFPTSQMWVLYSWKQPVGFLK